MSGGVDSSVTALLLKNQNYDIVGVFMKCWSGDASLDKLGMNCAWERDSEDARRVAQKLKIPFYVWDFEKEYKKKVVEYMVEGYKKGITPNPDVMCNKEIKFGLFFEKARALGADCVATGHYVRLERKLPITNYQFSNESKENKKLKIENCTLKIARDLNKDQSYFLWTLTQKQLTHCLFPIGDYEKPEIRKIARKAKLPTADKKDSQGICFLGKVSIADFLKKYIRPKRGEILTTSGKKVGEHQGVYFYTIGQRHLGVSGIKYQASGKGEEIRKHYVSEKNIKTNTLVVAEGEKNKALYKKEVELINVNFINPEFTSLIRANKRIGVLARVRYRQPLSSAKLLWTKTGLKIIFSKPQKFVAAGQSVVFYSKNGETLGGGIIT